MHPTLPTHAGTVALEFSSRQYSAARPHNENRLLLPELGSDDRFTPLKGGEQFLIVYQPRTDWRRAVFGGKDESAFVTGVGPMALAAFDEGGEGAFFEALKPKVIKDLEAVFSNAVVRRQGDIWSIGLTGMTWKDLGPGLHPKVTQCGVPRRVRRKRANLLSKSWEPFDINLSHAGTVLGTNHRFEGYIVQKSGLSARWESFSLRGVSLSQCMIGEGIMHAPDHAPHDLRGCPHVFARTPHLMPDMVVNGD